MSETGLFRFELYCIEDDEQFRSEIITILEMFADYLDELSTDGHTAMAANMNASRSIRHLCGEMQFGTLFDIQVAITEAAQNIKKACGPPSMGDCCGRP